MFEKLGEPNKSKRGGRRAGAGRKKGEPNKITALLKDAILMAATNAGGKDGLVGYLQIQAAANPGPFMGLLGKVLPMQIAGDADNPIQLVNRIERVTIDAADDRQDTADTDPAGVPTAH